MIETTNNPMIIDGFTGKGIVVRGNEIDTDRIIPARFMKCITFSGLGKYTFYDERYSEDGSMKTHSFNDNTFSKNPVLIVNKNFGCGSSREHAPQALKDYGIQAIIGESFAEIFAGNCTALGIPTVQLNESDILELQSSVEKNSETLIAIDLKAKKVIADNKSYHLTMQESYRKSFLDGTWDSTNLLLQAKADIEETARRLPYIQLSQS